MEEVAAALGDAPRWFQLYWPEDDELAASFLNRAEQAGYSAIVVTLDTYLLAWRERDIQNAYLPFFLGEGLANYLSDPVFRKAVGGDLAIQPGARPRVFRPDFFRPLAHLGRPGPALPVDATARAGQRDSARRRRPAGRRQGSGRRDRLQPRRPPARRGRGRTRCFAPSGRRRRRPDATVLFDSGIRRAADVFKAVALGARCVLLGRPYAFGLAVGGEQGVRDVLANLIADIDLTLGLAGCASFAEVARASLVSSN